MRKLGHDSIQSIIKRACKEFLEDEAALDRVSFSYKGHRVNAKFDWSKSRHVWYVSSFDIVYSNCVMKYFVRNDYDMVSALCW